MFYLNHILMFNAIYGKTSVFIHILLLDYTISNNIQNSYLPSLNAIILFAIQ